MIGLAVAMRCNQSAQPEEGIKITEPEKGRDAVEDDGSYRPQWPGTGGVDCEHVGEPTEEGGAPPVPHDGHMRIARLSGLGVIENPPAVALKPPPAILVN